MKSNETILKLINKKASVNEICSITGLSHKQLFYRMNMLKIKGYDFKKKYFYNGEIEYSLLKEFNQEIENEKTIITSPKDTEFKALLISDIHFGSIYERPELLFEVYNYAIKEGIHIIINTGDLVEGNINNIYSIEEQIENLLKIYPFDKNIINFICLGNHDFNCLTEQGLDLNKILNNKRHDLVSLGYGCSVLNIKNDQIIINHPGTPGLLKELDKTDKIVFSGHSHKFRNYNYLYYTHFTLPALSNIKYNRQEMLPSFIKVEIIFKGGYFFNAKLDQFIFIDNKLYNTTSNFVELGRNKNLNEPIKNEEEKITLSKKDIDKIINPIEKIKKLERKITSDMSQIEKFNARFGK